MYNVPTYKNINVYLYIFYIRLTIFIQIVCKTAAAAAVNDIFYPAAFCNMHHVTGVRAK